MNITEEERQRLLAQMSEAIRQLEEIKKSDIELREGVANYYETIVRQIEVALTKESLAMSNVCLNAIKQSLQDSAKELRRGTLPVGTGTETNP